MGPWRTAKTEDCKHVDIGHRTESLRTRYRCKSRCATGIVSTLRVCALIAIPAAEGGYSGVAYLRTTRCSITPPVLNYAAFHTNGTCNALDGCRYPALEPHPFCSRTCANAWNAADANNRALESDSATEAMQRATDREVAMQVQRAAERNAAEKETALVHGARLVAEERTRLEARKLKQARAAESRSEINRNKALEIKTNRSKALESEALKLVEERAALESEKRALARERDEAERQRSFRERYPNGIPQCPENVDYVPEAPLYPSVSGTPAVGLPILFSRKEALDAISSLTPTSPLVEIKRVSRSGVQSS